MATLIDLTGQKFGRWTVLERGKKKSYWLCKCDCGKTREVYTASLINGKSISCGCSKKENLTGQRFGKLVVIKEEKYKHLKSHWLCKCDCGKTIIVRVDCLKSGHTKSCGCYHVEKLIKRLSDENNLGMNKTRIHHIWRGIKDRCYNPSTQSYKNYGARGIGMCKEWHIFKNFYNDMIETYANHLTIDRIDVNKGYCKENCRWATQKEQGNNRRNNHILTYKNKQYTIAQLSDKFNIPYSVIQHRIHGNWDINRIVNTPVRKREGCK